MRTVLFLSVLSGLAAAFPAQEDQEHVERHGSSDAGPDPTLATKVSFNGNTFINKVRPSNDHSLSAFMLPLVLNSPNYRVLLPSV